MVTIVETASPPETACSVLHERSVDIEVGGLGKMYRVYERPQDRLKQMLFARFGRAYSDVFWPLRDASFTLMRGESFGVIGRNGTSTLLQMIAGMLTPTKGELAVSGRVAALLEYGSGFTPSLPDARALF